MTTRPADIPDFENVPPREMKSCVEWWVKCTTRVHHQTNDTNGEPKVLNLTVPQQGLRSLPLFRHPMGQSVKDCKTRGEMRACFLVDPETDALTIIISLGDMGPHIVPSSFRNRLSVYSFKPTFYLGGTALRADLPFEVVVDTSCLARSHGYQLVTDKQKDDKTEIYAYDHPLLTAVQSGQALEYPEWKNVTSLSDPISKTIIEETTLAYIDEADGSVSFDALLVDGHYLQVPQDQKGDVPQVQFKFKIVPMRGELEALNFFSAQSENTIVFDEVVVEFPKDKWPQFAKDWIGQWKSQPKVFEQSSEDWIFTQLPSFALEMSDVDLDPKENIPLIAVEFDAWAKANNYGKLAQVYSACQKTATNGGQAKVDQKQLEIFYSQLKKAVDHHLGQLHKAHIRQYDDFILSDVSSACGTDATKEQLDMQVAYKNADTKQAASSQVRPPSQTADVKSAPVSKSAPSEAQIVRQFYQHHLSGNVTTKTVTWEEVSKTKIRLTVFQADPEYIMDPFQESGSGRFMACLSRRK